MNTRRKAKDFFSPEPVHGPSSASNTPVPSKDNSIARRHSARLESRTSTKSPAPKLSLEQSPAKGSPRVSNATPVPGRMRTRKLSMESHSTDDVFVDAKDVLSPVTPSIYPNLSAGVPNKTPGTARTEDSYVSAVGSVNGKKRKISRLEGESTAEAEGVLSDGSTPLPSTQNTIVNIPSSQPRPRSQRSPLPLQPVPSSPAVSLPPSTSASEGRSTFDSITVLPLPKVVEPEDSDDEAPEAISLSAARSQAIQSQKQIAQKTQAEADKVRERRRQRDRLLAAQKQEKQEKQERLKLQIDVPNSQLSVDVINSGNTTDTPAPNQDHQAARIARHAEVPATTLPTALPTSILQAASKTWLQPEPTTIPTALSHTPKKRKERDDGVRILEEMNARLAPKAGKIGMSKEEMIMRMGRGERKMFIGRFAR